MGRMLMYVHFDLPYVKICINQMCYLGNSEPRYRKFSSLVTIPNTLSSFTFIGPCIVIYFYSITNQMHECIKFILFEQHCTCFVRSFRPSSGDQDCTYNNRHMSNRYCWLLPSGNEMFHLVPAR